jgi:hypothetical protein
MVPEAAKSRSNKSVFMFFIKIEFLFLIIHPQAFQNKGKVGVRDFITIIPKTFDNLILEFNLLTEFYEQ